jgi:predicted DNA-binding protein with PD1-like motif
MYPHYSLLTLSPMKTLLTERKRHLLAFEKGDEVLSGLKEYAKKEGVKAAWINILGACEKVTLAYYDLETKTYLKKTFDEELEVLGVMGNIALFEGEPLVHLHGTFSKADMSVIGGHLFDMTISATGETHLQIFEGGVKRAYDEVTGLNLMSCRVG